jgi:uncharacterized protein (TIGR02145 family)/uncharacterized repeat protein (TIGR02543 family)
MKKTTLTTIGALLAIAVLAQAPQGISHQAVIRDAANNLVTNSPIGIRVTIIQGNPDGISVYSETHTPVSNANGLITFIIGQDTGASGSFDQIDWSAGPYFIKTEADPTGGTNYTITGISQLFSVPYALHSGKASTLKNGQETGEILYWDGSEWVAISPGEHDETLRLCDGIPTWGECPYNLFLLAEPVRGGEVHGAGKYKAGEQAALSATLNQGWQFVNWSDVGGIVSMVPNFTYTMPASDVTLNANFEMIDYTLTLVADPIEGGSVTGGGNYNFEDEIQLNTSANTGWQFVNWTDGSGIVSELPDFYYSMPATDITLTANFEMIDYTLTLVADPSGGGTVTGSGDYNYEDEIQLNATASAGWQFVNWTDGEGIISLIPNFTYTMPADDITLTANFEMIDYALTLVANPTEGGSVTGGGDYNLGDVIQVDAVANTGWEFVNWTDDDVVVSETPNFTYTMPASDVTLTANFEMTDYTLTLIANPTEGGSVTGGGDYNLGDVIQIDAVANTGWEFVNWTGDTDYVNDPASPNTSVTMPAQNINLTANFVEEQSGFICGDPLIDSRDGQSYSTVQIGDQCWMAENLNVGTRINGNINQTNNAIFEKYCYNNSEAQCDVYGGLYQWNEMMGYSTTPGVQGICPDGWHLPNDEEWKILEGTVDSQYPVGDPEWDDTGWRGLDGGGKLKQTGTTHWTTPNTGATNSSGFTALPGGGRSTSGSFLNVGNYSLWWSSSQHASSAWFRYLGYDYTQVYRDINTASNGFSVRCLKNVSPPTTYDLILLAEPSEAGIVSGAAQYEAGEEVNITANANSGWEFVNWTDVGGIASETPNFTYTMPAENITLTANFVEEVPSFTCGDPLIDSRDGQSYTTVLIGDQCWMAENLNIGTQINGNSNQTNNATIEKYCYNNSEAQCDTYGGLYQWNEMMQYTTTDGAQGICPDGWHLPTDDEWKILEGTVDSQYPVGDPEWNDLEYRGLDAGGNLKAIGTTHWNSPNTGATNSSGFTALPGGFRDTNGSFQIKGSHGLWWSSSQTVSNDAWRRFLAYDNSQVFRSFLDNKSYGFSVRCLKD